MKKPVTKIICATLASVVALGISAAAGCSPYYKGEQLGGEGVFTADKAVSNGGFAVEKGDYVYFINGVESNTVDNTFGTPDKGAIKRISKADLNARNYSSVQTVVPQVAYSSNYSTGVFVYGDYIYYSTPSTARNSDGVIQNSNLELKRTKLDGTESLKTPYVTFPSDSYDFRFVEDSDGVVYVLYVATSETMFGETTGVTNLHSVNTSTGCDTLLAYNVASYLFDAEDKTNPAVYYTMNVMSFATGSTENYNQVYKVSAKATQAKEYDVSKLLWWKEDTNRYVNCGELVFDGIGGKTTEKTPFNYMPADETVKNDLVYSYTLEAYVNGTLFYTRHTSQNSAEYLYSLKDGDLTESWNPISSNPEQGETQILNSGSNADSYKFIFDDNGALNAVLFAESTGGISINYINSNGKLSADMDYEYYYRIVNTGTATLLEVDTENNYLYYSLSGGNGYTFYRVNYSGRWQDYNGMFETDEVSEFTPVQILDLDADSGWYKPEFIDGNILFASETDNMTSYNYIMAFNLKEDGKIMTNTQIDALNKLYEGVIGDEGIISGYADTDKYDSKIYANLSNAAKYLFYTADKAYIDKLAVACNAEVEKDADPVYSEDTLSKLADFLAPAEDNDWADYSATRQVDGKAVYANRRDYYYSTVGQMTSADAEALRDSFKTEYLASWPEKEEVSWWDGLNTVARVFFIIGMCVAGILVIGGITIGIIAIVRRSRGKKQPDYSRRRIKVDTTDDKDINVYETDSAEKSEDKRD